MRIAASLPAAALIAAVAWTASLGPALILGLHPAMLAGLGACLLLGIAMLVAGARSEDAGAGKTRGVFHSAAKLVGLALVLLLAAATAWLRPLPAESEALATVDGIAITETATEISLGADAPHERGFAFQPGAKVAPHAYIPILAKVAKACDCELVIVKQPLQIGFLAPNAVDAVRKEHPEVTRWALGGHSLGGVVAARAADEDPSIDALVLWASYPAEPLARTDLNVASIWGSADGLATSEKRAAAASRLPSSAAVTIVEGGVHSFFGDYGMQPGDGTPSVSREDAQARIIEATLAALAR